MAHCAHIPAFVLHQVTCQFATGQTLFGPLSVSLEPSLCGLVGRNGVGKTRLLRLLAGLDSPAGGHIERAAAVAWVAQQPTLTPETTLATLLGYASVFAALSRLEQGQGLADDFDLLDGHWDLTDRLSLAFREADLPPFSADRPAFSLSGGERMKALLCGAFVSGADYLLLDEPTNHLDIKACSWLEHFLMNYENTVIVVSHDRHFLNKVCTHIADVDYGKIKLFAGNYDFWYESSQLISRQLKDANSKKEEKIKELEDFIARFSANASKSRQATSRKKILDKITLDDLQPSTRKYPFIEFKPERESGRSILYIEDVEKQVEDCRLTNISFNMMKGDKVALIGNPLKTTLLLKLIAQELTPDAGSIQLGQTIKVSYIPDDNSAYFEGTQSICEWLSQYTDIDDMSFIRGFLGRMLFSGEEPLKPVNVLSGGEKARCMLSKTMLEAGNLLLMDDPINHLDLESIQTLNNALIKYPGELIFVSHDHQFIQTIANRIIEIRDDGIIDRRTTYDDYLEKEYGIEE